MKTETCTNCLEHISWNGADKMWQHVVTEDPQCQDAETIAVPR